MKCASILVGLWGAVIGLVGVGIMVDGTPIGGTVWLLAVIPNTFAAVLIFGWDKFKDKEKTHASGKSWITPFLRPRGVGLLIGGGFIVLVIAGILAGGFDI
jgi:hypothetical protein